MSGKYHPFGHLISNLFITLAILSCGLFSNIGGEQNVFVDAEGNKLDPDQFETKAISIGDLQLTIVSDKTRQRLDNVVPFGKDQPALLVGPNSDYNVYSLDVPPVQIDLNRYSSLSKNLPSDQLYDFLAERYSTNTNILFGYNLYTNRDILDIYDLGIDNTILVIESSMDSESQSAIKLASIRATDHIRVNIITGAIKVLKKLFWESFIQAVINMKIEKKQDTLNQMQLCTPNDPAWGCINIMVRDNQENPIESATVVFYLDTTTNPLDRDYQKLTVSQGTARFPVIHNYATLTDKLFYFVTVSKDGYADWDGRSCPFEARSDIVINYIITLSDADGTTTSCSESPANEEVSSSDDTPNDVDLDNDGYSGTADACPTEGNQGYGVDSKGCPLSAADTDADGVVDSADACPSKGNQGYGVDARGCPILAPDSDGDGVINSADACPNKGNQGYGVDSKGCPLSPPDTDGDGVINSADACPNKGNQGYGVDSKGCPLSPPDTDGDGVIDSADACPSKGNQGYGVDSKGCPNPAPDSDGDGVIDSADSCPSQGDQGYGVDSNGCPLSPPNSGGYVTEYFNDFDDLNSWILNKGLFSSRCGKPVGQRNSTIYLPSNVAAGYLKLPNPIAIQEGKELYIEIRYRFNDPGGMYIGFSPTNEYICNAEWRVDGAFFGLYGGEWTNPSGLALFLSQDHSRLDAVRVDRAMDDNWHIARIVRNSSAQEWSLYIDDEFIGSHPIVDNISDYKYLSFNAYGEGNLAAEIDYIRLYQE